jgi:hypothetical protein
MNSTHNVSETTKRIFLKEFGFFKQFTNMINSIGHVRFKWKEFFNDIDFFGYYSCFLQIDVLSTNIEDFKKWKGFVESRLRFLIKFLEEIVQIRIHPYPRDFPTHDSKFDFSTSYFFGIEFVDPKGLKDDIRVKDDLMVINLRSTIVKFCNKINEPIRTPISVVNVRNPQTMNLRILAKPNFKLPNEILNKEKKKSDVDVNSYDELEAAFYNKKRKLI